MDFTKTIADTIISQFGGNRALSMIGVAHITYAESKGDNNPNPAPVPCGVEGDVYIDILFKAKSAKVNGKSPNAVRIIYKKSLDLYDMVFYRVHGINVTTLKQHESVYGDMLKELFEGDTKLYLSF